MILFFLSCLHHLVACFLVCVIFYYKSDYPFIGQDEGCSSFWCHHNYSSYGCFEICWYVKGSVTSFQQKNCWGYIVDPCTTVQYFWSRISLANLQVTRCFQVEDNIAQAFCLIGELQAAMDHCQASIKVSFST